MSKLLQSYLRFWAKIYLNRTKPQIIAVTGSVGKTSTKEAIFEVLKVKFGDSIRKSEGNLNNETGVPLAILGYKKSPAKFWQWLPIIIVSIFKAIFSKKYHILVLEMAADKPGDIAYLTNFAKPKVAVITSIGPAHLAAFGTIKKVVEEKTSILKALPNDGIAILNLDDEHLKKICQNLQSNIKTFAINEEAEVRAQNITTEIVNFRPLTKFQVIMNSNKFMAQSNTLGRSANVYPLLAATAVAEIFGLDTNQIAQGIQNTKSEKHRMTVVRGINSSTILDDCYNASPISMKAALNVLKILSGKRKIAVLGDMRELGSISEESHRLIGEYARLICDEVLAVGESAKGYQATHYFSQKKDLISYLLSNVREDDIILIKASRAIGLEEIVEAIKE